MVGVHKTERGQYTSVKERLKEGMDIKVPGDIERGEWTAVPQGNGKMLMDPCTPGILKGANGPLCPREFERDQWTTVPREFERDQWTTVP